MESAKYDSWCFVGISKFLAITIILLTTYVKYLALKCCPPFPSAPKLHTYIQT